MATLVFPLPATQHLRAHMQSRTLTRPTADELRKALAKHGGSVTQTAKTLGVNRVTVHKWMRKWGIEVQRIVA